MKISILTLFPDMFAGLFDFSIIKRAKEKNLVEIELIDIRQFAEDKYKSVDDRPYGGGAGMIMRVDVIDRAIAGSKEKDTGNNGKIVLLDAGGEKFDQRKAEEFSKVEHLILIAGHYEGVDHRVHEHLVDEVISVGDFVVSGGEIPAMMVTDAVTRLIPGALGNPESLAEESFSQGVGYSVQGTEIEYPQYTRPEEYKGWKVPEVLLSGNHKEIEKWRKSSQ